MRLRLPLFLVAAAALVTTADARPKRQPADAKGGAGPTGKAAACGVKILPLAVGNSWTYMSVAAPAPPTDQINRMSPPQPAKIIITVQKIEPKGGETLVTLEEKLTIDRTKDPKKPNLEERAYTSTITCNDKKFDISPNSFFFAGEPGGVLGLEVDKLDRLKGTSWALTKGGVGEKPWREDLAMHWTRKPTEGSGAKLGAGKIELERQFTPQDPENIASKAGTYRAEKIGLVTTGRVTLEGASPGFKPMELPAGWMSTLWLADGVGLVQSINAFSHMYQLASSNLK